MGIVFLFQRLPVMVICYFLSKLMDKHCQRFHRPGSLGSFLLEMTKFSKKWCHFFLNPHFEWKKFSFGDFLKTTSEGEVKSQKKTQKIRAQMATTLHILKCIFFAISRLAIIKEITSEKVWEESRPEKYWFNTICWGTCFKEYKWIQRPRETYKKYPPIH